jgi:FAD/FMN-containing dehydrogenase
MPTIQNFGANQVWRPQAVFLPRSETELIGVLHTHRGRRFRAIGRLHSWSQAPVGDDVVVDLRNLNDITIHPHPEKPAVEVGAGCQIKRLVDDLNRRGYTLPSLGLIDEQSVAGATATGTHGSGKNSLAHYIEAARVARYDPQTGAPVIHTVGEGQELQAIRCSLGCLGVITRLRLQIRRQYHVEEHFCSYANLSEVLAQEEGYPLQQFFLLPWRWDYFAQHRREVDQPISRLAALYRCYWCGGMDVGLHVIIQLLVRARSPSLTKTFFRHVLTRLVPRPWRVVDRSHRQLTMQHELFRHIEIELFVKRSLLADAIACLREIMERFSTSGRYTHHYPICIRKVLPDATLLSMSNGWDEPAYALSVISYVKPDERDGFFALAQELAETLAQRFDARPHWGKYCPLAPGELRRLYPRWGEFAAIRNAADPENAFCNDWFQSIFRYRETNAGT